MSGPVDVGAVRWLVVAAAGCSSVADDMTAALTASHEALRRSLLGGELFSHVHDPPRALRHSPDSTCGAACPCVIQTGLYLPVTLTLDYPPEGCVPQSELLSARLAGHAELRFDGQTISDLDVIDLTVDGRVLDGHLDGTVLGDIGTPDIRAIGTLFGAPVDLHVDLGADISIDGVVHLDDAEVTLRDLVLPWEWLGAPCPRPQAGEASVSPVGGGPPSVVRFGEPGGGVVTVVRRSRTSDPVLYCDFLSP